MVSLQPDAIPPIRVVLRLFSCTGSLDCCFSSVETHAYESWVGRLGLASMLVISAN